MFEKVMVMSSNLVLERGGGQQRYGDITSYLHGDHMSFHFP